MESETKVKSVCARCTVFCSGGVEVLVSGEVVTPCVQRSTEVVSMNTIVTLRGHSVQEK